MVNLTLQERLMKKLREMREDQGPKKMRKMVRKDTKQ